MELVDTHQHLWDLERLPYSWCSGIPSLNRSFRLGDYQEAKAGLGIGRSVFVECDVDEPHLLDEARAIQALADSHPSIAGIVASCRPEKAGFGAHIEALARLPRVKGVRRILHTQPDELSEDPTFAENLRLLPQFGFSFDLCVLERQLPQAIRLVRACPGVSFILDHCGVPDIRGGALDPWRARMTELAALPNVACKLSGLIVYTDRTTWTAATLRPWVEHVVAIFGWDRLVWGGDWPVCTQAGTLAQWVAATRELVRHAGEREHARLFHENAERLYRLES